MHVDASNLAKETGRHRRPVGEATVVGALNLRDGGSHGPIQEIDRVRAEKLMPLAVVPRRSSAQIAYRVEFKRRAAVAG
jgi:hypothetical protein